MLKTNKNSKKETLKKLKSIQDTSNANLSDDCSDEGVTTVFKPSYRCPKCCLVPFITLKENESKIIMNCTNGHNKDIPLNEFMDKYLQKNFNNVECSECGLQLQPKKRFKFCSQCYKIFCKMCLKKHNANQNTSNHETISLRKMDTFCCLHRTRFAYYCEICHKNICEKCFPLHNNHQIISLKEIKLSKREIKDYRENLNQESMNIAEIEDIFKNCINSIKKKFDDVIQYKKQVIEFKKTIQDIYEAKESNFQIIDNVNRIKFNTQHINIEKDMNELDILFELFSYLNCIDYNICLTNSLLNLNDNSFQNNNLIQEEPIYEDNKKKDCIYINNNYEISFKNENASEKANEKEKGKEFIYEKKNKKFFENFMYDKEEEEKNDENKNNIFLKNNNLIVNNKNEKIKDKNDYIDIEQQKKLFKSIIKNNNNINIKNNITNIENFDNDDIDSNKNKKYAKKIMKGKINQKPLAKPNMSKSIPKEESKEISKIKYNNEEKRPIQNKNEPKVVNKMNNYAKINPNNIIMEELIHFEKKSNKNNVKFERVVDDEKNKVNKDKEMSKSDNSDSNIDENININNELNNIKKKTKKKSKSKDGNKEKSKEKPPKKVTKEQSKEQSKEKNEKVMDKITEKFSSKVRDKSKEKRIKIKRDNNMDSIEKGQLNHSFDNTLYNSNDLHYNSFEYTYQFKSHSKFNLDSNSKLERSYSSEMLLQKNQTGTDFKANRNKNNLKLIKLVNKNYYNDDNLQKQISSKKEESGVPKNLKTRFLSIKIEENKDGGKTLKDLISQSNTERTNRTNENRTEKINNIFYEISDDNASKEDDNLSKDVLYDNNNDNMSQDNNYLSNDDTSVDNDKKNKKKKKKIIKKKKKIKKKITVENNEQRNINDLIKEIKIMDKMSESNKGVPELKKNDEKEQLKNEKLFYSEKKVTVAIDDDNNEYKKTEHTSHTNKNCSSTFKKANETNQEKIKPPTPFGQVDEIPHIIPATTVTPFHTGAPSKQNQIKKEIKDTNITNVITKKKVKKIKVIKKQKKKKVDLSKSFDDVAKMLQPINISPSRKGNKTIQRSNSFDIINRGPELEGTAKVNSLKFESGISCLLEISKSIFAAGNLIGDIKIIEKYTYKEIQTIKEHNGTINSLFQLHDGTILSASADRLMKKIRLTNNNCSYNIEFVFDGYENYIFKGIELSNNKIISCSWDNKLFLWERKNNKYINSLKFNENQRVQDLLEITDNSFCSIADNEIKLWNSNNMYQLHSVKIQRSIVTQNSLCKVNDEILIAISYNAIHVVDLINFNLITTINMDQGNLSCITKLNDGSILIAEDINTDNYCIFYLKQYVLEGDELQYISFKKDKFYKTNKNNDKEVRALIQFSEGIIAQGIAGEFNGKDCGDIYFYE